VTYSLFKAGDLVQVINVCNAANFVYRPPDFPFGKVGIVVQTSLIHPLAFGHDRENEVEPFVFAYDYYASGRLWYSDELVEILVGDKKYWVFPDEIGLYEK
jgi:hypothetical protein